MVPTPETIDELASLTYELGRTSNRESEAGGIRAKAGKSIPLRGPGFRLSGGCCPTACASADAPAPLFVLIGTAVSLLPVSLAVLHTDPFRRPVMALTDW